MEHEKKRSPIRAWLFGQTPATVCFLLLAAVFVYACVLLVGSVLRTELSAAPNARPEADASTPAASAASAAPTPAEPAADVAAIITPAPIDEGVSPSPGRAESTPAPQPTAAPTPRPTLLPLRSALPFTGEQAEFLLLGFDAEARVDWIVAVTMQGRACTVMSVPRNTLSSAGTPLMRAASGNHAMRMLRSIWPVGYSYDVGLQLTDLPICVDQCGGITIEGRNYTGEQALAWLNEGAEEELLRIGRQQTLMRAYLEKLQQTSWLKLLTFKLALQDRVESNLSTGQLLALYTHFKQIDVDQITFCTLPVDSVVEAEERCYQPDAALINRMLEERAD